MELITKEEFENLHSQSGDISVSIFVPMEVTGNYEKNRIGYKTAVKNVEHKLEQMPEADEQATEKIIENLKSLMTGQKFWERQSEGLAVFATPGFIKYYEVPVNFEAFEYVADHFYLRPLIPILSGSGEFLILQLSKDDVRLFESTRYTIAEIYTADLSEDNLMLEDEVHDKRALQHHAPKESTIFHGHGAPADHEQHGLERYFRKVDDKLSEMLRESEMPMIIACVDYLFPIYKSINSYPHLMTDKHLSGSYEHADSLKLHRDAWEIVRSDYEMNLEKETKKVRDMRPQDRVEETIDSIIYNALDGNIQDLYIENRSTVWGKYNRSTSEITVYDGAKTGEMELLNTAAMETLKRGGKVHLIDEQYLNAMDPKGKAIAVLRY